MEAELPEARHVSVIEADPCDVTALPDRVDPMTLKLYSTVTLIGTITVSTTSAPELGLYSNNPPELSNHNALAEARFSGVFATISLEWEFSVLIVKTNSSSAAKLLPLCGVAISFWPACDVSCTLRLKQAVESAKATCVFAAIARIANDKRYNPRRAGIFTHIKNADNKARQRDAKDMRLAYLAVANMGIRRNIEGSASLVFAMMRRNVR
ncbi:MULTISPECIES: hypothetical protein [unclassified Rhizobium]|uniref:hypothetical protein n=1 Tax=unclassified Rhizobium TaxID=2613769 RepID=UPI00178076EC|nr:MULTISPECIES: hypothetical protein [unclassified Rhizobium]MBD8689424.1 hypothetical protein [Rhizobium sp. CFBP 13644]MBD8693817.1 hypothetical protein [Rhizobium sp. CFBP 13717]